MGYIQGYLAGVHSTYQFNSDLLKNRYEYVSSAISLDTMYSILNDICKQSGGVIFDQMNPLREKLLKLR